jgi:hypothetical protein
VVCAARDEHHFLVGLEEARAEDSANRTRPVHDETHDYDPPLNESIH